jgi:MYXO-CTERM domain-containing protein
VWEGDFRLGVDPAGGADGGPAGRVLGDGPGKAALRQGFALAPGRYRLQARVASAELRPGLYDQTSTLYLSGHAAAPLSRALVAGDSGWRTATLVFDVEPGFGDAVTAYFFGWGPGALYVDDLHLAALPACDDTAPGFTLGPVEAPLTAQLPASPSDDLLCAYCPALGGELCARCAGLPAPTPPPETRLLTDFEPGRPMPFERVTFVAEAQAPVEGTTSARLVPGRYLSGAPANGLPADWRGFDWLRFEVDNPSGAAVDFVVELRDAQTRDYWSRVNWYTTAPPGRHTLHVPLQVFVGEKSVIRERRRLALEAITRLVLLNAGTTDLLVDDVRLEAEPPLPHDDPRILKLDAGPSTGPVFPGFTPLLASTDVRPRRAYGFRPETRFGRIEDRRHPEALRRDWISVASGGLEFALPPGRYAVWMVLEDPGYWEYFPNYTRRVVRAEGASILDESPGVEDFWARYYAHADDEVLPGDDAWARFVDPRYTPLRAEVDVGDGGLTLDFEGSTYACALSALVIAPADDPELDLEGFLAGLDDRMRQHFAYEYTAIPSPAFAPDPAPAALEVAWVAPGRFLRADEPLPSDGRDTDVSLAALRGAVATQSMAVRRDADDTLVTATLALPGLTVTPRRVRHLLDRVTADGAVYQVAPRLLDPLALPLDLPAGVTRQLVFEVDVPADLPVDRVEGTLTLGLASGAEITRAVTVEVSAQRAVTLAEAGLQVGYLGLAPTYPQAVYPEVAEKQRAEVEPALDLLRRAGMSAVTGGLGGPALTGFDAAGEAVLDLSNAAPVLDAIAARAGDFTGPVSTYGGGALGGVPLYSVGDALFGRPFADGLRAFLAAWEAARAAHGWPDLRVTVGDEPAGDAIASGVALAQAVRATGMGVTTDVFTSFTALDDPRAAFIGNVDLMLLTHHSAEGIAALQAAGQGWGLYNQGGRYRRGVYLFALRAAGLRGYYQFAFSSVGADPYYALDAREDDLCAVYTHPSGALRPTVDFAQFAEAVSDLRALLTLSAAVDGAAPGPARDAASAFLSGVVAAVPIGHAEPEAFDAPALDALRADTFAHLRALAEAPVGVADAAVDAALPDAADLGAAPTADLGGIPTADLGTPVEDAAADPDLGAVPTPDLSVAPPADLGAVAPSPDAAPDAALPPELGVAPTADAVAAQLDALRPVDLGAVPTPDLGETADAQREGDAGQATRADTGCACRAGGGPVNAAPLALLVLAALPLRARRRARLTCRR